MPTRRMTRDTNRREKLEHASYLNTKGVFALTSGRVKDASKYFCEALDTLENRSHSVSESQQRPIRTSIPAASSIIHSNPMNDLVLTMPTLNSKGSCRTKQEQQRFVYQKAFFFNPSIALNPFAYTFYRGVITFNLALSVHCGSINNGEDSGLRAALVHYRQSLSMLMGALTSDIGKVCIAALNNLSNVLFDLGSFEKARSALDDLSSLISATKELEESPMDDEDMNEIILNVFLLQEPAAAAAA